MAEQGQIELSLVDSTSKRITGIRGIENPEQMKRLAVGALPGSRKCLSLSSLHALVMPLRTPGNTS